MLTEKEVLAEFRRIGIKEPALLRDHLMDFAEYVEKNYAVKILKSKEIKSKEDRSNARKKEEVFGNRVPICRILIPLFIAARVKTSAEDRRKGK